MGSQGVEPRASARDRWFTASCSRQCCSLPDAECSIEVGADDGTRTHDLNAGDVVFYLLNYIRMMTMMFVVLVDDAHRNMERTTGIEPAASSLEDSRSAS